MNPNLMQNDISNYTSIGHLLCVTIIDKLSIMITHINAYPQSRKNVENNKSQVVYDDLKLNGNKVL